MSEQGHWAYVADRVLKNIFVVGQPAPSAKELKDAYPFGERSYWPYKVWLRQVAAWKDAHADGRAEPSAKPTGAKAVKHRAEISDTETGDLFA